MNSMSEMSPSQKYAVLHPPPYTEPPEPWLGLWSACGNLTATAALSWWGLKVFNSSCITALACEPPPQNLNLVLLFALVIAAASTALALFALIRGSSRGPAAAGLLALVLTLAVGLTGGSALGL